jgi:hypothetical protein
MRYLTRFVRERSVYQISVSMPAAGTPEWSLNGLANPICARLAVRLSRQNRALESGHHLRA